MIVPGRPILAIVISTNKTIAIIRMFLLYFLISKWIPWSIWYWPNDVKNFVMCLQQKRHIIPKYTITK
jgi:hypothetical protein